jgi:hypothetical protein
MVRAMMKSLLLRSILLGGALSLTSGPAARASDHADPIFNRRLEAGITDLFAFPTKNGLPVQPEKGAAREADSLVLIICTRRSLAASPPYEGLDQYTFKIHMDLGYDPRTDEPRAAVNFQNRADLARYGGTVVNPELIKADVTITAQLNDDTSFKVQNVEGDRLKQKHRIRWYSGLRDDPVILPQFFGTNVIAVVVSIPFECFPGEQTDWLIWATSWRHEGQIDHVGRSQRTQLPRFDLLNTLHPSRHVSAIRERRDNPGLIQDVVLTRIVTVFAIVSYEVKP